MKEQKEKINIGSAVALGFFDGIHLGHKAVIGRMVEISQEENLTPVVYTFKKNPALMFGKSAEIITTNGERTEILKKLGVKKVVEDDFTEIKDLSPKDFVKKILSDRFRAKEVVCGFNYHFGKGGLGDTHILTNLCGEYNINVTVVPPVIVKGDTVSSTRIRSLIKQGDIKEANRLLDYRFGFIAVIEEGNHIGRQMDTPTINQQLPKGIAIPKFGVYTSIVTIEGQKYAGVTNIGVKPTVGSYGPVCETWLPQYRGENLYGKTADIRLVAFQRAEKKFNSLDELGLAIKKDGEKALDNLRGLLD